MKVSFKIVSQSFIYSLSMSNNKDDEMKHPSHFAIYMDGFCEIKKRRILLINGTFLTYIIYQFDFVHDVWYIPHNTQIKLV